MSDIAWGPNGKLVFDRTYSRVKSDGTRETWPETVERVVEGNLSLAPARYQLPDEREDLIRYITEFKLLPAGRHLWASGLGGGAQHLFNCFSGDTLVHTEQGVFPINTLAGQTHNVLSEGGKYRPARFDSYGEQALWCVELSTGEEFLATEDHSWVTYNSGETYRHTTKKLTGKRIPYNIAPAPVMGERYWEGVAHGIVYGDGTPHGSSTVVRLFGEKRELSRFLKSYTRTEILEHEDYTYVGTLPGHWKSLPSELVTREYARGFIVGLIATDGYTRNGTVQINTSKDPGAIHRLIISAGLVPGNIGVDRETSPYDGSYKPCYRVGIRGWSILPGRDLLRPLHFLRFGETKEVTGPRTVKVKKVWRTEYVEEVFCAVEPETHTITVGSGVLTGQCWVSGAGNRLAEHCEFTFTRLMEGGGVGVNYSNSYFSHYPVVENELVVDIVCDPSHKDYASLEEAGVLSNRYHPDWAGSYEVGDSREGWAEALSDLLDTYYRTDVAHPRRVYDVSNIRPAGARLRTFGGTASGPLPFARMMKAVSDIMNGPNGIYYRRLTGLEVMQLDHEIAQCVVAGGVRRSARMSIMHWDDPDIHRFIYCKADTGSHWTTNISVEVDDRFWCELAAGGSHASRVYDAITDGMVRNGEPGFWDSSMSNADEPNEVVCTNPCQPKSTWIQTANGPKKIADLIGKKFVAVVDGKPYNSLSDGFFKTGDKGVFRLDTDEGWSSEVTANHEVYRPDGSRVEVQNLSPGDKIRLSDHRAIVPWGGRGSEAEGYALGWLIGDGTFGPHAILQSQGKEATERSRKEMELFVRSLPHRSDFRGWVGPYSTGQMRLGTKEFSERAAEWGVVKGNKTITDLIEYGSWDLYVGILRGLFDTDGHVEYSVNSGVSVRLSSSDESMLHRAQRMLGRMGIRSSVKRMHDTKTMTCPNTGNDYESRPSYRLLITSRLNVIRFRDLIGFWHTDKDAKLADGIDAYGAEREVKFEATFKSLTYLRNEDVYDCTIEEVYDFCGDGFLMRDCGEIPLQPWEPCNLGHINLAAFVDPDSGATDILGLYKAHKLMTRFLIRATYATVSDPKSREVLDRNRRIGVGHLGVASYLAMVGVRYSEAPRDADITGLLTQLARYVDEAASEYSNQLRIPVPVKKRTIAPTGTIAKLPGVSEGIHPIFSKYFNRRIRFSAVDAEQYEVAMKYKAEGYTVEDDMYAANTLVVTFPTKDTLVAAVEQITGSAAQADYLVESAWDLTLEQLLEFQAWYQLHWADNAVSFTANLPTTVDVEYVRRCVGKFAGRLKGATIFPDASMPQAPYERITKSEYEAAAIKVVSDGVNEECATGACPVR